MRGVCGRRVAHAIRASTSHSRLSVIDSRNTKRRSQMSMSKIALLAGGLMLAIAAVAPAREYGELEIRERALMYLNPTTGKVMMMAFGTKGHDMIMKSGRPMAAPMLLYRSGGNIYALEDKDGQIMKDIAKGDYF
jgi:hypothetical protein